jgi:hypothetical protein
LFSHEKCRQNTKILAEEKFRCFQNPNLLISLIFLDFLYTGWAKINVAQRSFGEARKISFVCEKCKRDFCVAFFDLSFIMSSGEPNLRSAHLLYV